jgi:hypothetical protein
MPFFWNTIARRGQLYGNRSLGSLVGVTNRHRFSYPGYNEILTGFADDRIDSNDKKPNPNRTILEFANAQPKLRGRVAAFGSWDVFPYIINEERSGIPVNAGFEAVPERDISEREKILNQLQRVVPSPWATVRLDAFTHYYAFEYLQRRKPRLLYIAYGETDDFAHDQKYDFYLDAAQRTDDFIRELWSCGANRWSDHGADVPGADEIWIAVLGPDSPPLGDSALRGQFFQNQIASTIAVLLGLQYTPDRPAGEPLRLALPVRR